MRKTLRTILLSITSALCLTACLLGVIGCTKPSDPPRANISAVKTASHGATGYTVDLGDEIVYTITLTNTGNAKGSATITDEVPANTTFVSGCENAVENNLS